MIEISSIVKRSLLGFIMIFTFLVSLLAYAQDYPRCEGFGDLSEKENFCPRIEGTHPAGCCPALQGDTLTCYYAAYRQSGQPTLINSKYSTCENDVTVEHACCKPSRSPCYENIQERQFISFLNFSEDQRPKGCCFALCPNASYWTDHPNAGLRMPGTYFRLGEIIPPNLCQSQRIDQCTNGGGACKKSTPCPTIPSPNPNPNPMPLPMPVPPNPVPPNPTPNPSPSPPSPPPAPGGGG